MSSFKVSIYASYLLLRSCLGKRWVCTPLWTRGIVLRWINVDFLCWIRILIVQTSWKDHLSKFFSRHSNSSSIVNHDYNFFFYENLKEIFLGLKTFPVVYLSIMFLALECCLSVFPKNASFNVSSRYWDCHFSVNRLLVSCMLVSDDI